MSVDQEELSHESKNTKMVIKEREGGVALQLVDKNVPFLTVGPEEARTVDAEEGEPLVKVARNRTVAELEEEVT